MAIQIGKYKRPGIFIEEFDNSVISSPTVAGITTLVMGSSRKGPLNTPVLLNNVNDLQSIFGNIDSNLERKGSYFHRTVAQMLQSSPVYAINLGYLSDTLDTVEYKSVSTRTDKSNDIERTGAYRKMFDTTGFWKRSTESFITLTKNDPDIADRLLAFTNLSDKYVTLFIYKSKMNGFDSNMIQWYGSADKVPSYLNQLDYASDYMVDVVVVAGDWSNYQQLSVDSIWSSYFTSNGLIKTQVSNFINNRNVNVLAYYEGLSLIPYFRDSNGKNIFIETIINADTDKTGIFCYFDADKLEAFYPDGMVDLIGNNLLNTDALVDNGQATIDYLSYSATITENLTFTNTPLDMVGNVAAFGPSMSITRQDWGSPTRTTYFAEGYINGVTRSSLNIGSTSSISVSFNVADANLGSGSTASYAVIGGSKVLVNSGVNGTTTFTIPSSSSNYTLSTATSSYVSVFYIESSSGNILSKDSTTSTNPSLSTNDLVLGYMNFNVVNGFFSYATYSNVMVNNSGYVDLQLTTDFTITNPSAGQIKVTFTDTAATDSTNNYERHRRVRLFNYILNMLDSSNLYEMTMLKDVTTFEKLSLGGASLVTYNVATTANKSFTLNLGTSTTPTDISLGNLMFYKVDNELLIENDGFNTRSTIATASFGVVGQYSNFYTSFFNGVVNTGDYFYQNVIDPTIPTRVVFQNTGTQSYIVFDSGTINPLDYPTVSISGSSLNTGSYIFDGDHDYHASLTDPATGVAYTGSYNAYRITNANLVNEDLSGITTVYDASTKIYLQMYLDSSNSLYVKYMDELLQATLPINAVYNTTITLISDKSNYKQTIEISQPTGYTPVTNKILVNATRYAEVVVGDFLEAYVDMTMVEAGQMPRNLTRIISKKLYSPDTTLVEITCDSPINKVVVGGGLQTMRYSTIDNYVTTYQAIPLKGFKLREASLPDGTEAQQSNILNLMAKGTPLFKAVTNKEAFDIRYLVDAYGLGLTERSKQQLVDICGERLDCLGFLNMPSMKSFKKSTSPSFLNADGVLDTAYIAQGGDLESNPAFLYSFGDGVGASSVGYFLPYVTVNDNGRPTDVPPAMFVATTYMRKQNSNVTSITPWTIAAGVTNGKVNNIAGIEMNFNPTDIENLNGAQMNPIVYKRNRGFVIETENTGQTLYKSALSYLHVREVLIELERELASMLLDFQWKFNTSDIRAEIKLRADVICERYISKNGLYNYFNKCDSENNTATIIDNQIGVLDTYVEPIKGMGIIVNNITILKTGAINSGGFTVQ